MLSMHRRDTWRNTGFPSSSAGKESACNAGDPGLIPGLGRSPGEGIGYALQYSWAFLVAQTVKNLPAMQETWIWSLGWGDPLEDGMATHSSTLVWKIPWTEEPGRLQFMGLQRVGHDWVTKHSTAQETYLEKYCLFPETYSTTAPRCMCMNHRRAEKGDGGRCWAGFSHVWFRAESGPRLVRHVIRRSVHHPARPSDFKLHKTDGTHKTGPWHPPMPWFQRPEPLHLTLPCILLLRPVSILKLPDAFTNCVHVCLVLCDLW